MIKELIHYLTLSTRTKNRLNFCIDTLKKENLVVKKTIQTYLKSGDIHLAVKYLTEKGEELSIYEPLYWSNLYSIAIDHKIRNHIQILSEKAASLHSGTN